MMAKQAASRGVVLPKSYYPLTALAKQPLPVPMELALSISRRESEFDPEVVSPVGARGLMQLMPRTAEAMAARIGLQYSLPRLTGDWQYNATLGAAYLAQLIEQFGASPVLVSAAYNAGPSRAIRWIQDYGDPRMAGVDVVDWIETIPFEETRNYIMRVTESLHVYRARLSGTTPPLRLGAELASR
jgi:soluble lytic murein transglycosylase